MSGPPNTAPQTTTPPVTAPPPTTTPPNGVAPQASSDWVASLTPELRQVVEIKGYKTPADVVQAYAHAEKAVGAEKIVLPKDGVWDDDARAKLGIPKEPTGYEVQRPEMPPGLAYDENFEKAALPIAHKLGLTPHQVAGLMEFYSGYQGEVFKNGQVELQQAMEGSAALLKKEWGSTYDTNVHRAKIAAKHFGGDAFVNFLNSSGMGNNPDIVRTFAKIGGQMTEDQLKLGSGTGFGLSPEEAQKEARKYMAHPAYNDKSHPEHADIVEKAHTAFKQAFPETA